MGPEFMPSLCGDIYAVMTRGMKGYGGSSVLRGGDMDLIFVGITVLFFAVSGWLLSSLEKL